MRKIVLPIVLTALSLSFADAATRTHAAQVDTTRPPARWETYTFSGEEFSVKLPEMPVLDHTSRELKESPNQYEKGRSYAAYNDGVIYLIRAYDKPRAGEDFDYFLNNFVPPQSIPDNRIEIKAQRELTRDKFPGRQYAVVSTGRPPNLAHSSIYVFLTKRHAYAIRAVGGDDNHPDVQRFFKSFALTDKPDGRQIVDERIRLSMVLVPQAPGSQPTKTSPGVAPKTTGFGSGVGTGEPRSVGPGRGGMNTGTPSSKSADGAVAAEKIYPPREVTNKALVIYKPEPFYTEEARRNQVTGKVRLRIVLSADGKVSRLTPVSRLPDGLTEAALLAAKHIKFIPAMKGGQRVSQYAVIEYNFNIY